MKGYLVKLVAAAVGISSLAFAGDFFSEGDKALSTKEKTPVLVKVDNATKKPIQIVALTGVATEEAKALKSASSEDKGEFIREIEKNSTAVRDNSLAVLTKPDQDRATSAWYGYYYGYSSYAVIWTSWVYTYSWVWYVPRYTYYVYYW